MPSVGGRVGALGSRWLGPMVGVAGASVAASAGDVVGASITGEMVPTTGPETGDIVGVTVCGFDAGATVGRPVTGPTTGEMVGTGFPEGDNVSRLNGAIVGADAVDGARLIAVGCTVCGEGCLAIFEDLLLDVLLVE